MFYCITRTRFLLTLAHLCIIGAHYRIQDYDRNVCVVLVSNSLIMGTIETRDNEREITMGYVVYIGTISTLAYSLLNSALAAMGA